MRRRKQNRLWPGTESCDGFLKKKNSKVPVYNQSRLRRNGRTCYFGPQPKAGTPGTGKDNPIDLCDEEDDWV